MLAQLAQAGDERGLARAHLLAYWVHMEAGRTTPGAGPRGRAMQSRPARDGY